MDFAIPIIVNKAAKVGKSIFLQKKYYFKNLLSTAAWSSPY